jgi:TetR/AcrR family transcriptional regulator
MDHSISTHCEAYFRPSIRATAMLARSDPVKAIRRRNADRTRAEIVAVAERHFAERGFEAARLEGIATEVGIRRASMSYYFDDKEEIYAAVIDEVFRDWMADVVRIDGGPVERLEASLIAWIDYVTRRPRVARLILREVANARPGMVSQVVRSGSAASKWFRAVIDEGVASGELRPVVEPHRFMSLIGAMTVFHVAAMPCLVPGETGDRASQGEIERQKHEILVVARTMLGVAGGTR